MHPSAPRQPVSRLLDLGGLELHLLEWPGSGPPVLMLHGWLDQGWTFHWLAQHLPRRLLAWDARGHGRSGRAASQDFYHFFDYLWDLHQLLDRLELERVILLGHSMGGMVASLFAGTCPERVAGLISLEGWIVPDSPPEAIPARVRLWLEQRSQAREPRFLPSLDEAAVRLQHQDPRLTPEQAALLARTGTCGPEHELLWCHDPRHRMRSPQPFRLDQARAFWRNLHCPVLLLYGAESEALQLPDWEQRLQAFAGAETGVIPAAGHNLHLHQPQLLADRIGLWLEKVV